MTHISQVDKDAESGADDESDHDLDAGRIDLEESEDDPDGASAALRFAANAGAHEVMRDPTAADAAAASGNGADGGSSSGGLLGSAASGEAGGGACGGDGMDVDCVAGAVAGGSSGDGGGEVDRGVHAPELEHGGSGATKKKTRRRQRASKSARDQAKPAAEPPTD